jgi:phenylacetate-CoA ligase
MWSEREVWSRDQIESYQLQALKKQLAYVGQHSQYYRRLFGQTGFAPQDFRSIADLSALPVTRKADYVAGIDAAPPWGEHIAAKREDVTRIHFSSGTTNRPVHVAWTAADKELWTDMFARYFYGQGLRPGDVYQVMVSFAWFVGGLGVSQAVERVGATVIAAGNQDSRRQVETLFDYGTAALFATPSFVAHLAEVATEMGRDLRETKVKFMDVGGEPGGGLPGTRQRIEQMWATQVYDCYGMLEFQPTAWEMPAKEGLVVAEDFVLAQVVDAETLQEVPDGTPGVLVLTHLEKQASPLVRWWTGDIVIRDRRPGSDKRTFARLCGGVQGRADDMLVIRGVNLFPSAVEDVLRKIPGVGGEYQIVLDESLKDSSGFWTGIKLHIESEGVAERGLDLTVAHQIREVLKVRTVVQVHPFGTLPRSVHKAKRVIREGR